MNKKILVLIMAVFTGLIFLTVSALIAADVDVPDVITIENKGYQKDKKGPVTFSHKKHHDEYKEACTECHHDYKDGKNTWKEGDPVKKCSECHDPEKKNGKVMKLQNAYHRNCKNCHKEVVEKDSSKKAPYKKCTKCHGKKS